METRYNFSYSIRNKKLGRIYSVYASNDSCPHTCKLYKTACYAESGHVIMHWRKSSKTLAELLAWIGTLPKGSIVRYGVAGDLPGQDTEIDRESLFAIAKKAKECGVFIYSYTHKEIDKELFETLKSYGFFLNKSCDALAEVDKYCANNIPSAIAVPTDFPDQSITPDGNKIIVCPQQSKKQDLTCADCKLCMRERNVTIAFRAHGTYANKFPATL